MRTWERVRPAAPRDTCRPDVPAVPRLAASTSRDNASLTPEAHHEHECQAPEPPPDPRRDRADAAGGLRRETDQRDDQEEQRASAQLVVPAACPDRAEPE